ncbi:MAG: glycerol kinase GlpK [Oligoflexia bacterium]|nr:glycerol kinase GlpK [Oligoflexia bacterium]
MISNQSYILSIDQGTTGTTCALVNSNDFSFVGKVTTEFAQHFPCPGEVEHHLDDIWASVRSSTLELLKKYSVDGKQIITIGITNQRETVAAFNKKGNGLMPAIVWQDRRTTDYCQQLVKEGRGPWVQQKTGLTIDPYFSATKILWALKNNLQVQRGLNNQDLFFGTIDTFLLYKLTSGKSYFTDVTNASRYLLMNIKTGEWDNDLLDFFAINTKILPVINDTFSDFGKTAGVGFLPDGIPISCLMGDQQSALLGQGGIDRGDVKCTYGTGAFLLMNTGEDLVYSNSGLLTTVAYRHKNKIQYALEGSSYIAGAAVQWMRDQLVLFKNSSDIEALAHQVRDLQEMEHILFLPFFTGIGSPYWKSDAKGAIVGITRDTQMSHLSRACLEGIALSINDLLTAFTTDLSKGISVSSTTVTANTMNNGSTLYALTVDGGASSNNLLMEIQANISDLPIVRPEVTETTAYGAALGAAIGLGILKLSETKKFWREERRFFPSSDPRTKTFYKNKIKQWNDVIKKLYL